MSFCRLMTSESEDVVFETGYDNSYEPEESTDSVATKVQKSPPKPSSPPLHNQFMYIQVSRLTYT